MAARRFPSACTWAATSGRPYGCFTAMTRGDGALTETDGSGTLDTKADFYVSPAGEAIEGKYESWIGRNRRDEMMERAENQRLKNVVGQIYRADSVIGDGSLADRMMLEQQRGLPLQPQTMQSIMEASEYLRTLAQLKTLSASDIRLANMLLRKLELARGK